MGNTMVVEDHQDSYFRFFEKHTLLSYDIDKWYLAG